MEILERELDGLRFDVCLDLHEDWEAEGFYMYGGRADDRWLGPGIVAAVSELGMIDTETDDNDIPLALGLLQVDPAWGGRSLASFLFRRHADHVMIFETPTSWPLPQRVNVQQTGVHAVLSHYAGGDPV